MARTAKEIITSAATDATYLAYTVDVQLPDCTAASSGNAVKIGIGGNVWWKNLRPQIRYMETTASPLPHSSTQLHKPCCHFPAAWSSWF